LTHKIKYEQTSGKIRRSTCRDFVLQKSGLQLIIGGMFDAGDASQLKGKLTVFGYYYC